jgi:undecaprenyl-diphosphatase
MLSTIAAAGGLSRHYLQWRADTLHVSSASPAGGTLRLARDGETVTGPAEVVFGKRPRSLLIFRPAD